MAKEPDQTKWVGIRPTDPSEDIPTTTIKVAPAIADLQAIKDIYSYRLIGTNLDCSVSWTHYRPDIPAGEIWILTHVTIMNQISMCDLFFRVKSGGDLLQMYGWHSIPPDILNTWNGFCLLKEDDNISFEVRLGGALDTVQLAIMGYKTGVY